MTTRIRMTAMAVLTSIGVSLFSVGAAEAGSKGKRNTAIGLGAVAVYGIVKKKPLVAGLAGGGAIYSYMQSRKDAKKERQRAAARRSRRGRYARSSRYYYVRRNGRLVRVARR
jgi:hypothetical protein